MILASDTPQPDNGKQPERHCDHECVCPDYKASTDQDEDNPCNLACLDDTRNHAPITPAPTRMYVYGIPATSENAIKVKFALEEHDTALIQRTIETIEDKCPSYPSELGDMVLLSDIQSLFNQPPTTGSTTSPAKGKEIKCPKCGGVMQLDPEYQDYVCMTFQCQNVITGKEGE